MTEYRMRNVDPFGRLGEVVDKGTEIYDSRLKQLLEPDHVGEYVVINVDTGEYELDKDRLAASDRAAARHPGARLYATRVGYRTIGRLGFRVSR
jgi:hypothetical protein